MPQGAAQDGCRVCGSGNTSFVQARAAPLSRMLTHVFVLVAVVGRDMRTAVTGPVHASSGVTVEPFWSS